MPEVPTLEHLLKRDRTVTVAGLVILCVLAWLYVVTGAGLGMSARQMTTLAFFPHQQAQALMPEMPGMQMDAGRSAWGFTTWTRGDDVLGLSDASPL